MGCKYVKEFTFGGKVAAPAKYAKGGSVAAKTPSRKVMVKREAEETPRMQREEMVQRASMKMPARRTVPVAPASPMIAMKKGGSAAKARC